MNSQPLKTTNSQWKGRKNSKKLASHFPLAFAVVVVVFVVAAAEK